MQYEVPLLSIHQEARDIFTLTLEPLLGFTFKPGQYALLGESPMAIASGVHDASLQFSVRLTESTKNLLSKKPGEKILLRGPYGTFFDLEKLNQQTLYLIAGGTGMAPLRSVARSLNNQPTKIFYGARTFADVMYQNEHFDADMFLAVEQGEGKTLGLVTEALQLEEFSADDVAYVCGPQPMLQAVVTLLLKKGLSENNIFVSVAKTDADGQVIGPVLNILDPLFTDRNKNHP